MTQAELLAKFVLAAESAGVGYFVSGSLASSMWGEPRFTRDIDVVVQATPDSIERLCAAFSEDEFYLSLESAVEAARLGRMFNIIHIQSGNKLDIIVAGHGEFERHATDRAIARELPGGSIAMFASPEDVILAKLRWASAAPSDRQLRDVVSILRTRGTAIDWRHLEHWADLLGVQALLDRVRRAASSEGNV